jgi:hypothetical protein
LIGAFLLLGFLPFSFGSEALASQRGVKKVKLKHHFREIGSATLVAPKSGE